MNKEWYMDWSGDCLCAYESYFNVLSELGIDTKRELFTAN